MLTSDRREFLKGTAASLVVAGSPAPRGWRRATGGMKMKPTAQDVLLVIDVQNASRPALPGGEGRRSDHPAHQPARHRLRARRAHAGLAYPGHVSFASSHRERNRSRRPSCPTGLRSSGRITACRDAGAIYTRIPDPHAELIIRKGYRSRWIPTRRSTRPTARRRRAHGLLEGRGSTRFPRRSRNRLLLAWSAMDAQAASVPW